MLLISLVAAALELKMLFITSFTVPIFQLHEIPFSMKLQLLTDPLLIKMKSKIYFLYGNPTYSVNNKLILDGSMKYILETKRFEGPIFLVN